MKIIPQLVICFLRFVLDKMVKLVKCHEMIPTTENEIINAKNGKICCLQSVTADTFKENAFTWFQINVHVVCAVQIRIKTFGGMNCRQNEKKLEIV